MSSARIDKLKGLLARVEQRRAQPRLRAVPSPVAAAVAAPAAAASEDADADDFAKTDPPPALLLTEKKPAKPPASPLEDAMALLDQSGPLDVQALAEPIAMKPASDARPAEWPRAPEPPARPRPPEPEPPVAPLAAAPVEPSPLTAPTQSIEPSPLSAAVAPARVVSTVRVEAPRSFGELLELSLALRPR